MEGPRCLSVGWKPRISARKHSCHLGTATTLPQYGLKGSRWVLISVCIHNVANHTNTAGSVAMFPLPLREPQQLHSFVQPPEKQQSLLDWADQLLSLIVLMIVLNWRIRNNGVGSTPQNTLWTLGPLLFPAQETSSRKHYWKELGHRGRVSHHSRLCANWCPNTILGSRKPLPSLLCVNWCLNTVSWNMPALKLECRGLPRKTSYWHITTTICG